MIRYDITVGARLIHTNRDMRFVSRRNAELDFVCDRTGERLTLTDEELQAEIARGKARLVRADGGLNSGGTIKRAADFTMLAEKDKTEARRRLAYVNDARSAGLVHRIKEQDITSSIRCTAARTQDPEPPCARTLKRWIKKAGDTPAASKLITNNKAKGNRDDRLDAVVRDIVEEKIDTIYIQRPPPSVETLQAHVRTALNAINKNRIDPLPCPSVEALRHSIEKRDLELVKRGRYGANAARNEYSPVRSRPSPKAPLDLVELDHSKCDLFVIDERHWLPIGRPVIAISADRCTRMPFGLHIGFDPPSVHTVMQCLRNGMLPKLYMEEKRRSGEWDIKNSLPACGRPRTLLLDRALENLGNDLDDFAGEIGIHLRFAPRRSGWYKGAIERFIRTVNKEMLHEQRGTTFSNFLERDDYDPEKNAVITLGELIYILHRWLADVFAARKHKGMRDIPRRRWDELIVQYPVDPIEDIEDFDMLFGRVEHATLRRSGLTYKYIEYISDELVMLLRDPAFLIHSPDRRVKFRYDPADLSEIRAYIPHLGRYLRVPPSPAWKDHVRGLSIWEHDNILKFEHRRTAGALDLDGIAQAKVDIAAFFQQAWESRKIGTRVRAARHDGIGRLAPAGASSKTSPDGSVDSRRTLANAQTLKGGATILPANALPKRHTKTATLLTNEASLPEGVETSDEVDIYAQIRSSCADE
ncbi:MAG: Mu transposase C-terminal domain-containing protein [Rhodoblastus sp.]|uniref:Mu transposase C-terminal domain-containing protein n=1 Tax=Rhodoblastus sp. TaxID=1962975 RepID=UPI003F99AAD9